MLTCLVIVANSDIGIYRILLPNGANVLALPNVLKRNKNLMRFKPNYIYDLLWLFPREKFAASQHIQWNAPEGVTP